MSGEPTATPPTMAEMASPTMAETASLRKAETASPMMAETALPQPTRNGHRQLAPRSRPRLGRALRQPLLPGPRSSPFHIPPTVLLCPYAPSWPRQVSLAPPHPGRGASYQSPPGPPPVTDITESLLVRTRPSAWAVLPAVVIMYRAGRQPITMDETGSRCPDTGVITAGHSLFLGAGAAGWRDGSARLEDAAGGRGTRPRRIDTRPRRIGVRPRRPWRRPGPMACVAARGLN